jgi:hypothetical protein
VERHCERLEHRAGAVVQAGRERVALVGTHDHELRERAVGRRRRAGAAQHDRAAAQVPSTALAVVADSAGPRRVRRDPVAHREAIDTVAQGGDLRRELMPEDEGAGGHEGAAAAVLEVMEVGSADARAAHAQPHHAGPRHGNGHRPD